MATVAFIGLGNMGGPMAINLVAGGHAVTVFDLVPESCAQLRESGAQVADSASAAAAGAEYVVSMLPAGKHVAGVYLGVDGGDAGLLAQLDVSSINSTLVARALSLSGESSDRAGLHPGQLDATASYSRSVVGMSVAQASPPWGGATEAMPDQRFGVAGARRACGLVASG